MFLGRNYRKSDVQQLTFEMQGGALCTWNEIYRMFGAAERIIL